MKYCDRAEAENPCISVPLPAEDGGKGEQEVEGDGGGPILVEEPKPGHI